MLEERMERIAMFIAGLAIAAIIVAATIIALVKPAPTQILSSNQGQYVKVCVNNETGALRSSANCKDFETEMDLVRHFPDSSQ